MRKLRSLTWIALIFGLISLISIDPLSGQAGNFEQVFANYKASVAEKSLRKRADAINDLAATGDPRASKYLCTRYTVNDKQPHPLEVRQIVAGSMGLLADVDGSQSATNALFDTFKPGKDTWMKYQLLRNMSSGPRKQDILDMVDVKKLNPIDRAVVIEALSKQRVEEVLPKIENILGALPKSAYDRRLLLSACSAAFLNLRGSKSSAEFISAAKKFVLLFQNKVIHKDSKLIMARYLSKALGTENFGLDIKRWNFALEGNPEAREAGKGKTVARRKPKFFGLLGIGDKIVYVIDVSASMGQKINHEDFKELDEDEEEEEEKKKPAVTGKGKEKEKEKEEKKPRKMPWGKIRNRLDLAKEALKMSVLDLDPEMKFAVVMFANRVRTLKATPKLIDASEANIKKVVKEIDNIGLGIIGNGETEMHPGLRMAFRVNEKTMVKEHTQDTDAAAVLQGGNVFYVLSDGAPTNDDFTTAAEKSPRGNLQRGGPYLNLETFRRDLERLTFHRKPEMHCIGIAISRREWLEAIAQIGMGNVKFMGKVN